MNFEELTTEQQRALLGRALNEYSSDLKQRFSDALPSLFDRRNYIEKRPLDIREIVTRTN
jgi:hypothetical protein